MKKSLLIILFAVISWFGFGQDYIFKKDSSVQKVKILEITTEKIKFKKAEVPNGPTYEMLLSDALKIRYSNGFVDWLGNEQFEKSDSLTTDTRIKGFKKFTDTLGYSMLYVLFNSGQDESQKFPIYLNGEYVTTLKNHTRLSYKVYSEGIFTFERKGSKGSGDEPVILLYMVRGNSYGIRIDIPYPWALKPNKRFSLTLIDDEIEINDFLKFEFNGFEPFRPNDIKLVEGQTSSDSN